MKIKLLKDLPTCQKGNIAELTGSVFVFNSNTRSPLHFYKDEIEMMTEWFEVVRETPNITKEQAKELYENAVALLDAWRSCNMDYELSRLSETLDAIKNA